MACRIPIIASRIEGNIAVLGSEHPGLFDPNSLDEYRSLVLRTTRDEGFRKALLTAQDRLLHDLPEAPRIAQDLGRLYTEIIPG